MMPTVLATPRHALALTAMLVLLAACAEDSATSPARPGSDPTATASAARVATPGDTNAVLAQLRRVTARYHVLDTALAEGFVLLHECENRPGEGPVGTVYVHLGRLLDGAIDPEMPDALVYEPQPNGALALVGAEFAIPYAMWPAATPPTFMGATFQREDEFGVFALHAWVWRPNPSGMFAETNPRVSCGDA
ncbi:MAG TPA: hypothetical protein VFV33_15065 [Gemmatimonadaceae bacterium]|nr:hypothetical protein [Gemmatimonadaceae bacterium]